MKKHLGILAVASVLLFPVAANAATFVQTSDDCGGRGCGINANNVINITDNGGQTQISVSLASGWSFVDTGANGSGGSFNFGLNNAISPLTFTAVTPASFTTAAGGFQVQGGSPSSGATSTAAGAAISAPAKFDFSNGYALTCNTNGASSACSGSLTFLVNSTLAAFLANLATSNGSNFFADVLSSNGQTGIIDFSLGQVPIPGAAILFGSALVGLIALGRRKKAKPSMA
jgi:hypothetical protein